MADAPENSLEAIRTAKRNGANAVELDVMPSDRGPVCAHDSAKLSGAPLLGDALRLAREQGLWVELDLKTSILGDPVFLRNVLRIANEEHPTRVWVSAFQPLAAWWVRQLDPEMPLGWPMVGLAWDGPAWWLGASVLEPRADLATPARVEEWRAEGWTVEVWTLEEPQASRFRELGAGVVSDSLEAR